MEQQTVFIIIVVVIIVLAIWTGSQSAATREGLTDKTTADGRTGGSGEVGNAANYAAALKAKAVELQDQLLVSKYKGDYEKVIINLDEYLDGLMLEQTLNLKLDGGKEMLAGLTALNTMRTAKDNLNLVMDYVDKH